MKETKSSKRMFWQHHFVILAGLLVILQGASLGDTCHYAVAGDLNSDCKVDFRDVAVLALNWLIDCNATPEEPVCIPLDIDGDGYDASVDCNDDDPNINPGATEIVDGKDNNCNGEIDEEPCPPDGTACDDGDDCTHDDVYLDCVCIGTPYVCDDANPCTTDMCDGTGGCMSIPEPGTACNDNDACTLNDMCDETGVCIGTPIDCDDENPCTADSCDPVTGECIHVPEPDGTACGPGYECQGGACVPAP